MIDRYNSKNSIVGTLYLTATHLIFVDPEANKETWVCNLLLLFALATGTVNLIGDFSSPAAAR
jgi:fucose permease